MGDLCKCWDAINNLIIMQHTGIKASFEKNIHFVGHSNNVTLYKRLHEFVSRYALNHIEDELDRVKFVGVDKDCCELAIYAMG